MRTFLVWLVMLLLGATAQSEAAPRAPRLPLTVTTRAGTVLETCALLGDSIYKLALGRDAGLSLSGAHLSLHEWQEGNGLPRWLRDDLKERAIGVYQLWQEPPEYLADLVERDCRMRRR